MLRCKKAQVGETISWVIATLVIIGILMIFIYISVLMAESKKITNIELKISDSEEKINLLTEKSSLAHQLANNRNKEVIDNILDENEQEG